MHGDAAHNRIWEAATGTRMLYLKAQAIEFAHPADGRRLRIEAPWRGEWHRVFERFGICPAYEVLRAPPEPSGGVRYHLRALRNRQRLWGPYRDGLAEIFATETTGPGQTLILIGPSGGYCIPDGILASFSRILAWDIDPLAEPIFRRLHPQVSARVSWHAQDFLELMRIHNFDSKRFFATLPGVDPATAWVLFAGFLGQVDFLIPDAEIWLARLAQFLAPLAWGSFHDRISFDGLPKTLKTSRCERPESLSALINRYVPSGVSEVEDHEITSFFKEAGGGRRPGGDFSTCPGALPIGEPTSWR